MSIYLPASYRCQPFSINEKINFQSSKSNFFLVTHSKLFNKVIKTNLMKELSELTIPNIGFKRVEADFR